MTKLRKHLETAWLLAQLVVIGVLTLIFGVFIVTTTWQIMSGPDNPWWYWGMP